MKLLQTLVASTALVAALTGIASAQTATMSDDSKFLLRTRALYVAPNEEGTTDAAGGDVTLDDSVVPEIDLTYFVTKNIGVEAIAAITPHNANVANSALGNLDLGSVTLLPPTVNLQYHFNPEGTIRPYVGAGVNYTVFFNEHAGVSVNKVDYDNSFGYSFQAGADYMLNDKLSINLDVKKLKLDTDVTVNNAIHSSVDIDPLIVGVGVGYRF